MPAPRLPTLATLALAAVFAAGPALAQKSRNTVRFGYDQIPENIDPYFNNVRIGVIVGQHVWDTLIYRDPLTNEYKPQLATAWRWLGDRTLELDLRQGVKFHNGEPFDADDVVTTLNFVANPENKSTTQQNVNWIRNVEKVEPFKVRIHTSKIFPAAIEYLAGPVVIHPGEYYAKVGPKGMNEKPVGSGPFKIVENLPGKSVTMERNAEYWKDSPKPVPAIQRLVIRFIPDRQTQMAEVLAGGLDAIMNVAPDQAEQVKAVPNLTAVSGETMRVAFLQMNTLPDGPAPPLRELKVRQAINHAIDRETMAKTLVGEGARTLQTICFRTQFGCPGEGVPQYSYDPAKAKQLLAEAGFPQGFDIDLYTYRDRPQAEAIVNYLRAVGIRANLRSMQYAAFRDQNRAGKAPMAHQTWGSFSVNDASAAIPVFYKFLDDDVNRDPQVRDLLEKGDSTVDPEARKAAYLGAAKIMAEKAYAVPLYSLVTFYVLAGDLLFKPYPDEMPRFWEVKWK